MTNNNNYKTITTNEKIAWLGHFLCAAGGLLITCSKINLVLQSGKITDQPAPDYTINREMHSQRNDQSYSAHDYFRRG